MNWSIVTQWSLVLGNARARTHVTCVLCPLKKLRSAGRQCRPAIRKTRHTWLSGNYHYLGYVAYGSLRYHFCWLLVLFLAQDDLMLNRENMVEYSLSLSQYVWIGLPVASQQLKLHPLNVSREFLAEISQTVYPIYDLFSSWLQTSQFQCSKNCDQQRGRTGWLLVISPYQPLPA